MFSHGRTPHTSEESYKDDQLGEGGRDQRAAAAKAVFVADEVMRQILLSPNTQERKGEEILGEDGEGPSMVNLIQYPSKK